MDASVGRVFGRCRYEREETVCGVVGGRGRLPRGRGLGPDGEADGDDSRWWGLAGGPSLPTLPYVGQMMLMTDDYKLD